MSDVGCTRTWHGTILRILRVELAGSKQGTRFAWTPAPPDMGIEQVTISLFALASKALRRLRRNINGFVHSPTAAYDVKSDNAICKVHCQCNNHGEVTCGKLGNRP